MAPPKKSKKLKKDAKKLKKRKIKNKTKSGKIISTVPVDNKAVDSDWWDSFWHKNSSSPGFACFYFLLNFIKFLLSFCSLTAMVEIIFIFIFWQIHFPDLGHSPWSSILALKLQVSRMHI